MRIGIDVGGTNIESCLIPDKAQSIDDMVFRHRRYPKSIDKDGLCSCLSDCVCELLSCMHITTADIENIGIAMPGSLDVSEGIIVHAYNLGMNLVPITDMLKSALSIDCIHLINDADAAAVGEFRFGALRGITSGCMITLGTGVGAGLIIGGKIYRGGKSRGTEYGHMTLDIDGKLCSCGRRGCIETLCSGTYLANEGKAEYGDDAVTAKDVCDRAKAGDEKAVRIFEKYTDNLAAAVAAYQTLLDPERIAIGGGVSLCGEFLFSPVRKKAQERCFFSPIGDIVPAELGDKAGAIGAAFA